ncbi:hypothetical protein B0A55_12478 [Friedmanniomyces simplex]|uniref:Uncharacterized protein n=1 Tax=Friedmanniomyces simplex TaxID=329884 RepID=A0A4U0W4D9_9PEZI|nr:hypothetical protein B0A55_12478 [Friedmanniomyces simplex]
MPGDGLVGGAEVSVSQTAATPADVEEPQASNNKLLTRGFSGLGESQVIPPYYNDTGSIIAPGKRNALNSLTLSEGVDKMENGFKPLKVGEDLRRTLPEGALTGSRLRGAVPAE